MRRAGIDRAAASTARRRNSGSEAESKPAGIRRPPRNPRRARPAPRPAGPGRSPRAQGWQRSRREALANDMAKRAQAHGIAIGGRGYDSPGADARSRDCRVTGSRCSISRLPGYPVIKASRPGTAVGGAWRDDGISTGLAAISALWPDRRHQGRRSDPAARRPRRPAMPAPSARPERRGREPGAASGRLALGPGAIGTHSSRLDTTRSQPRKSRTGRIVVQ